VIPNQQAYRRMCFEIKLMNWWRRGVSWEYELMCCASVTCAWEGWNIEDVC
jgi:hypothetical protein